MFNQILGHLHQLGLVFQQQSLGLAVGAADELAHFHINFLGDFVAVVAFLADFAAQEYQLLALAESAGAQAGRHPVALDHPQCGLGGAFNVVAGAGGDFVKNQFLGHAPAHHHRQHILKLVLGPQVAILLGQQGGVAAHIAAGDDADFVHPVGVGQVPGHQGVARFVVGGHLLFPLADDAALAFRAGDDPLNGFLKVLHIDAGLVFAGGQQGGFVDQVGKVGAAEAGGFAGQDFDLDLFGQGLAGGVHFQDGGAAGDIGQVQGNAAVKAAGPQQRRVQDVRAVGGGNDDDVGIGLKAVHFHQNLVEGLLPLVVAPAEAGAAMPPHGVDFVHKEDAGGVALGLFKEVAHAGGAHAHEHFHEFAAGDVEERHARFAGHGAGQQGFARPRRPHQQHAFGDARAQL